MGVYILLLFVLCAIYVQTRGKVGHDKLTRRLSDHSNLFAPINCLFYFTSSIRNTAFVDPDLFTELNVLQENWQLIRDEALALDEQSAISASEDLDDIGFNSFFKTGWKRFYLKWYGVDLNSAQRLCPETFDILADIDSVKGAMFAMLPPGARLVRHRDPYAGSLRYHLGLVTPNDDDCYINVDGETYSWRDGEAVMFDETYLHYAENQTESNRIVLFLDIKRPVQYAWVDKFNSFFSRIMLGASATKNMPGDKVGLINRAYAPIYKVREVGKRVKAWNRPFYYMAQYAIYLMIIIWLFF